MKLNENTKAILNSLPEPFLLLTSGGKIHLANKPICDLLGYKNAELVDQEIGLILARKENLTVNSFMHSISHGDHLRDEKIFFISKDKKEVPILLSSSSVKGKSRIIQWVMCVAKPLIHEKKMGTSQIIKKDPGHSSRLTRLGELAAGIAHELSQPLSIIRTGLEVLHIGFEEGQALTKSEYEEFVLRGIRQVDRAQKIINAILNSSRLDKGISSFISPGNCVKEALYLYGMQITLSGVKVKTEIEKGLPLLTVNPQKLQQVVHILIDNAWFAVKKKRKTKNYQKKIIIRLSADREMEVLTFEIEDNGIGMSREGVMRCMDSFYTTKGDGEGTGLGLSIANSIVQDLRGKLEVKSVEGEGSTFSFSLPYKL